MHLSRRSTLTQFAMIIMVATFLTGCGNSLDGTYTPEGGAGLISSITFKGGGKCELTGLGMTKKAPTKSKATRPRSPSPVTPTSSPSMTKDA